MPFHQRTVEPARLRPPEAAGAAGAPLFRSLEQVSSHALVCLLAQLADLSRCAGDIFGELEGQAAALGRRTAALHRRLDALHAAAARLDHRRVKIREWRAAPGRGTRWGGVRPAAPSRPLAAPGRLSGIRAESRSPEPRPRARVRLWGGDGRTRDPAVVQVAGACARRSSTLGLRRFLAASMEYGNWAGPVPLSCPSLSVWEAERSPGGAVDRGGAKVVGKGSEEGGRFEKPGAM